MHLFYQPQLSNGIHLLEGEEFKHCVKVLRHVEGDAIHVTDGNGLMVEATIGKILKDTLTLNLISSDSVDPDPHEVNLYIAPTKQVERMEWMVEKLSEIGIHSITFISTSNSERTKLRLDRLEKKALSALKQSKGRWLTKINPLVDFKLAAQSSRSDQKVMAAVEEQLNHYGKVIRKQSSTDVFIGPEGDFSQEEIEWAKKNGITLVNLGERVLRTETAGLLTCYFITTINQF
jgi:16S rRNA (uracil1498-N3)-methyltransferase